MLITLLASFLIVLLVVKASSSPEKPFRWRRVWIGTGILCGLDVLVGISIAIWSRNIMSDIVLTTKQDGQGNYSSTVIVKGREEDRFPEREHIVTFKYDGAEHKLGVTIPKGWEILTPEPENLLHCASTTEFPVSEFALSSAELPFARAVLMDTVDPKVFFKNIDATEPAVKTQLWGESKIAGARCLWGTVLNNKPYYHVGQFRMFMYKRLLFTFYFALRDTDRTAFEARTPGFIRIADSVWIDEKPTQPVTSVAPLPGK